jgi:hypothetical protein
MSDSEQILSEDRLSSWTARDLTKELTRSTLERVPRLFFRMARRRNPHRLLIDKSTDLVIEGFPRSGSTYLVSSLALANPDLHIASHLHSVAHIYSAIRKSIPVVMVLREPLEAVASEYLNKQGRNDPMGLPKLLYRYTHFYSQALRYDKDMVISPFETTTRHPQLVARVLRDRFGMPIDPSSKPDDREVLANIDTANALHAGRLNELTVARPSEARVELAGRIKQHLAENYASRLAELQDLHDTLAASTTAVRRDDHDFE